MNTTSALRVRKSIQEMQDDYTTDPSGFRRVRGI
jgi:hypothetical protein